MADLRDEFEARGPWITRFDVGGVMLGGDYFAASDERLGIFFDHFPEPGRVLELGCLEGGHTFPLAQRAASVVAIDSREANLARARWLQTVFQQWNIRFLQANLETYAFDGVGPFDVVFNCGVLYHLPEPWTLLRRLAPLTRAMLVWTHICDDGQARRVVEGYRGRRYSEGGRADPLSGMSRHSFWPTRDSLLRMLLDTGFTEPRIVREDAANPNGPALFLVCRTEATTLPR